MQEETILDMEVKLQAIIEAEIATKGRSHYYACDNVYTYTNLAGNSLSIGALHHLKWINEKGHTMSYKLVGKISTKWRDIGLAIGLTIDQLTAWDYQYRGNVILCWTRVMECWLKGESDEYPATWNGLYTLLEDMELARVSLELKKAVAASFPEDDDIDTVLTDEEEKCSTDKGNSSIQQSSVDGSTSSDDEDAGEYQELNDAHTNENTIDDRAITPSSSEMSEEVDVNEYQLKIIELSWVRVNCVDFQNYLHNT